MNCTKSFLPLKQHMQNVHTLRIFYRRQVEMQNLGILVGSIHVNGVGMDDDESSRWHCLIVH